MYIYPSKYHATQPNVADVLAQNGLAQLKSCHVKTTENFNNITGLLHDEVVDMRADSNETDSDKANMPGINARSHKPPFAELDCCPSSCPHGPSPFSIVGVTP